MIKTPPSARGFTLLEVLVAAAILALLMVILLGSATSSLSLWRVTEARMAADREGRSAFQLLADDLANAVVPTNPAFWPKISNSAGLSGNLISFLTRKPLDYQDSDDGDFGDICYVEYSVQPQAGFNHLQRRFLGSRQTYQLGLSLGKLPEIPGGSAVWQLLSTNVITNNLALKGTAIAKSSVSTDVNALRPNFTALILSDGVYQATNTASPRPDAIQVSIGAADLDTLRNPSLLANPNIPLRAGGFYTFTVNLPSP